MEKFNLTSVIWKEEDVYVSKCPELEIASVGDTPQEAKDNLKEAIELYLENAKLLGILDDIYPAMKTQNKFTSTFEVEV